MKRTIQNPDTTTYTVTNTTCLNTKDTIVDIVGSGFHSQSEIMVWGVVFGRGRCKYIRPFSYRQSISPINRTGQKHKQIYLFGTDKIVGRT